jgi:uncharacterized protein YndB with AHSA1/START domain
MARNAETRHPILYWRRPDIAEGATILNQQHSTTGQGTLRSPHYFDGPVDSQGDEKLRTRLFAYHTDAGVVAGGVWSVIFTIDRPAKQIWPYFKDFNLWMNSYGYYWPGVMGDMYTREERDFEKGTFRITVKKPNETAQEFNHYQLLSVIPEHLIVFYQPILEGDVHGGVSPGFNVFMLNEHDGKTIVTITMEHATRARDKSEEEAVEAWREIAQKVHRFWRDIFVPNLKKLAYEGK